MSHSKWAKAIRALEAQYRWTADKGKAMPYLCHDKERMKAISPFAHSGISSSFLRLISLKPRFSATLIVNAL